MKILFNNCYGGYGLSKEFIEFFKKNSALDVKHLEYLNRHDPELIRLVEQFGLERAGNNTELEICEIPDACSYKIIEYDGWEAVEFWINVTMTELRNGLSEEKLSLIQAGSTIKVINNSL
jgi:hypothetical protein